MHPQRATRAPVRWAILCAVPSLVAASSARAQPVVDIGLYAGASGDTLEVRVSPGVDFDGVVGSLTFTIRWEAASGTSLDLAGITSPCPGAFPGGYSYDAVVGAYRYATINSFGIEQLAVACPGEVWQSGQQHVVFRIPVVNPTSCAGFNIVNDAWTSANNRDFYISLGGLDRTGSIVSAPVPVVPCGLLTGRVMDDQTGDCIGDFPMPWRTVTIQPGDQVLQTGPDGRFSIALPPGGYTVDHGSPPGIHPVCPPTASVPVQVLLDTVHLDFVDSTDAPFDLELVAAHGIAVPGFPHQQSLIVRNRSGQVSGPVMLILQLHSALNFGFSVPPASVLNGQQVDIPVGGLGPYEEITVQVHHTVTPDPQLIGSTLLTTAVVSDGQNEADLTNNAAMLAPTVVGSYDPNDKLVHPADGYTIGEDDRITYTIRFQNTGNYPAQTFWLVDSLSAELDRATFEAGPCSHPCTFDLIGEGVLHISFPGVILPDSVNNEAESHGYASFSLRPAQPVVPGSVIHNEADIFFDFNPPVRTNDASVVILQPTGMGTLLNSTLSVHPVPALDRLRVTGLPAAGATAMVHDPMGRLLWKGRLEQGAAEVDLRSFSAGSYLLVLRTTEGAPTSLRFVKE